MIGGLVDTVKVLMREENVTDGYGNVKLITPVINNKYHCRKTKTNADITDYMSFMETRWSSRPQGMGTASVWIVLGEYDKDIKEGMLLEFTTANKTKERFEIIKLEANRDAAGNGRFLKLLVEKLR